MSNRFDTTGGFTPPAIKTPPSSTANVAGFSSSQKAGDQLAGDARSSNSSGKDKAASSKPTQEYEFEGNRLGISPMKIGLLLGIGLIAYGLLGSISFSGSSATGKQVQHEYRRQLRPVDLPGR